jgi:hypothetical protein
MEPTAEDWIILRCIYGWTKALTDWESNWTARKSMRWLVGKLGVVRVRWMIDQLEKEQ